MQNGRIDGIVLDLSIEVKIRFAEGRTTKYSIYISVINPLFTYIRPLVTEISHSLKIQGGLKMRWFQDSKRKYFPSTKYLLLSTAREILLNLVFSDNARFSNGLFADPNISSGGPFYLST